MKTKIKSIFVLAILMMCMSSCVYSLFPIYTEETLVYLPELEGKWQLGDDPGEYIIFKKALQIDGTISVTNTEESVDKKVKVSSTLNMSFGDDEYVILEGDTVRDREKVKAYYQKELEQPMNELGETMKKTLEGLGNAVKTLASGPGRLDSYVGDSDSYQMTIHNGDDIYKYKVHLAKIGDDLFMDLYATEDAYTDKAFGSMVWFPVHTFMKLEIEGDEITITQFDLDKMNRLFESNLIRMNHENVDGTILITASSEEIQKFLKKYSRDESVYDEVEVYSRVTEE